MLLQLVNKIIKNKIMQSLFNHILIRKNDFHKTNKFINSLSKLLFKL